MTPQQLKNSILQFAIQGKLVEQCADEGTAEELYRQIQEEKQKLIKEGKIKKEKPLPEITDDEIPFEIPDNWKWVRIGELANYKKGPFGSALTKSIFVSKSDNAVKVYEQKNAIQKNSSLGGNYITKEYFEDKMSSFEVIPGDIIVSCAGTIGELYRLPFNIEKGIINQALMRVRLYEPISCEFYELLFDYLIKDYSRKSSKGSAIKNIPPFDILKKYIIPFPPLAEQKRIVAKIEELMNLVDEYKDSYEQLVELNKKFPSDIQKSILQYAIQGKLVEQRADEGTAEELYQQIQEEKQKLIKEGKIKKEKPLPEITEDEIPFDIPESWKWVRLSDIIDVRDGTHDSPKYHAKGVPLITSKNLNNGTLSFDNVKYISEEDAKVINKRSKVDNDDILFAMIGSIGNPVLVKKDKEFCIKNVALFKKNSYINMNWLYNILIKQQYELKKIASGGVQSFISLKMFRNNLIPLPPLAEQKRIVAKIEELMALSNQLKQ